MKEYDAAIIGAGIGGLMCGALLAHRGYKVLIFEKNAFLGGCCSSFVRGGFTFDACVHWFSGCGPGSFIDKLFRKIGIELPFIKYVPMDCFHFADRTVIVPEKIEEYQELLIKNYPAEEAGIKAFFQEMEHNNELLFSLVMDFGKARDLYANEKILNQTFQEVLDKFIKSNSLKAILAAQWGFIGSPPDKASATVMMSMMYNYYKDGAYYPAGGAQKFADIIGNYIRTHGGEIKTRSEVTEFITENNKIKGVRLKDSSEYKARIYIANADAKHVVNKLLGNAKFDDPGWEIFKSKTNSMKESMSMFILYLGLNVPGKELRDKIGWYYGDSLGELDSGKSHPEYATEGYLVNVPSALDPSICPENKSVMILYTNIPDGFYDGVADWDEMKRQYERKCLDFIDRNILKDAEKHIEIKVTASPKTIYRYTYNAKGAAYGWAMTPDQIWAKRLPIQTPIDELLFAGHWSVPGGSVILSAISGWMASFRAVNYLTSQGGAYEQS